MAFGHNGCTPTRFIAFDQRCHTARRDHAQDHWKEFGGSADIVAIDEGWGGEATRDAMQHLQYATVMQDDLAPTEEEKGQGWAQGVIGNRNTKGLSREGKAIVFMA